MTAATNIIGSFGTLTINPDGSFFYDVDSTNATLMALTAGQTVTETFTYRVVDTAGLSDLAELNIIVRGVNDPPVANDVYAVAVEAGGIANGDAGLNPSGDATANDYDPDGDPISVVAIRTGPESGSGTAGSLGSALQGTYGSLTLNANGTYTYVLDNNNAAVQALRSSANTLSETFTYQIADNASTPETDLGQIIITIEGRNDNPLGSNDSATAIEAGGLNNAVAGTNPTGNVLNNDTDLDGGEIPADPINYGETKVVSAVRTGGETATGTAGIIGAALVGTYGSLTLNDDGSYQYVVDNNNAAVQALRSSGNTLTELFTYTVSDTAGASDLAQLSITIQGANDTPLANPDTATAVEAGGLNNGTPGTNPNGNVLSNDSDVDSGDLHTVTRLTNSASVSGTLGVALSGTYGSLTLNADGSYSYALDNSNSTVQGLRNSGNSLTETFTYTMQDSAGATSSTTLTITIRGTNDNPQAINDTGTAVEAGGSNNATPGSNATGNVLHNDTDVDNAAYGESKTVSTIRTGSETGSGTAGSIGNPLTGTYGSLTLNADGSYSYVVDNNNATVQALRTTANTLSETFTYSMRDTAGATDIAQLRITIRGANDTPEAVNDGALGWPAIIGSPGSGRNPSGNVLDNDSDIDSGDSKSVSGIRSGTETAGGILTAVTSGTSSGSGERINGTYGWLNIGADGSYLYEVDFARTAGLAPTDIVRDHFTYELADTAGLVDLAQLTVFIRGRNNPPIALPVLALADEAGGIANGTPGLDPSGNVLARHIDLEGDPLTITGIRTGVELGNGTAGSLGSELAGMYGWLTQQADGTFTYRVNNDHPLIQALRNTSNTLEDFFTYTVSDIYGAVDQASIAIIIRGANDNPLATDDNGTAVEAGGIRNATQGNNATGNVLANDSDVDAYGETKTVTTIRTGIESDSGIAGSAGSLIVGRYGALLMNADGSYTYTVTNDNPDVEALRSNAETLTESFTYQVIDALGATDTAQLNITIRGANDTPLARDDSASVTDANGPAVTSGNVLPNDSDVDAGESKTVTAIRTGEESGTGSNGLIGQPLQGRYGFLLINADGSYTYRVDTSNPDVIRAQGQGPILQDVFTYTMADRDGASDQAQLTITLDMMAPYIGLNGDWGGNPYASNSQERPTYRLGLEPVTFVTQAVREVELLLNFSGSETGGEKIRLVLPPEISLISQAGELGLNDDQGVRPLVQQASGEGINRTVTSGHGQLLRPTLRFLDILNRFEKSKVNGREGVVSLTADGLLPDISVFSAQLPSTANDRAPNSPAAASFSQQLQQQGSKPGKLLPPARPAN